MEPRYTGLCLEQRPWERCFTRENAEVQTVPGAASRACCRNVHWTKEACHEAARLHLELRLAEKSKASGRWLSRRSLLGMLGKICEGVGCDAAQVSFPQGGTQSGLWRSQALRWCMERNLLLQLQLERPRYTNLVCQ